MIQRARLRRTLLSAIMIPIAVLMGLPFYYILVSTVKTQGEVGREPLGLPSRLFVDNYIQAFTTLPLAQSFLNTAYVTVVSVAVMLLFGSMAAFGIILGKSRLIRAVGVLLIVSFLVPFQSTIIPLYRLFAKVGLVDTLEGLILITSGGAVFSYFLIVGYMRTVPFEIIEAARMDGAGPFRIYWQIVLPLIRPILVTVGVFQTMGVWNDFIAPSVFLSSPGNSTLILQVYRAVGQFSTNWPMFMTVSVIALIPMVIFFLLLQKHIVSGLVGGSLKG
ncbi:carbohydrate ABC transporter permease [Clavibacter michiganensis]|uniref:carbohydrate ABC transporter permease n=1 Tax=Clavibacter michiganensis TaxID=28447 RepID=UPI000CE913FC|nr:carbohydrate ABC transporter permease [Clavibacter michiganensis]PPF56471.1 carbohydrate ABC transporter permease [Clavibacter michiganensis]